MKKRIVSLILIAFMLISLGTNTFVKPSMASSTDTSKIFVDIKANAWYKKAVDYCYDLGILAGTSANEFGRTTNVTRGMFITTLARITGVDTSKAANKVTTKFSDVKSGKYYSAAIKWASDYNIVSGTSSTTFSPDKAISRQDLCVMIVNYSKFMNITLATREAEINFSDEQSIAKYAKNAVKLCQTADIVNGYATDRSFEFRPKNTATRAEAAQILYVFHSGYNSGKISGTGIATPVNPQLIDSYSGTPYAIINNNIPNFNSSELTTTSYESYGAIDSLGRCRVAIASIGRDIMPTENRGSIDSVQPTGWHTIKYDCVDGQYLYNRCHLIGFQLTGENANEKNLITGTRYMNVDGMLPFENMVADYVKETGNHVAYRATPIFSGNNLLVSGVQIEAYSIEDDGEGICFNVYCYNVQPGVNIDYSNGESSLSSTLEPTPDPTPDPTPITIYKTPTGKRYHYDRECAGKNAIETTLTEAQSLGLTPCKTCVE